MASGGGELDFYICAPFSCLKLKWLILFVLKIISSAVAQKLSNR
jgi:hypothetical protein